LISYTEKMRNGFLEGKVIPQHSFRYHKHQAVKRGKQPVLNKPLAGGKQKCVTKIKAKRILNFHSMT
jgi:hypothetical protein